MKLVKAKREAEAADSAYRKGVFHLETLRLQRERTSRSAVTSVLDCVAEMSVSAATTIKQYNDVMLWRSTAIGAIARAGALSVQNIQPDVDVRVLQGRLSDVLLILWTGYRMRNSTANHT